MSAATKPEHLEVHPAASWLPLLDDRALAELAEDIREHGLRHPIVLFEGKVLDGRNRLAACAIAGVQPTTVQWKGEADPFAYAWSVNVPRRHLPAGARAALKQKQLSASEEWRAARQESADRKKSNLKQAASRSGNSATSEKRKAKPSKSAKTRERAAKEAGVSPRTMQDAITVAERAPELLDKVAAGDIPLSKAVKEAAKERPPKPEDRAGTPIPSAIAATWGAMAVASTAVLRSIEAAEKVLFRELGTLSATDGERMAANVPGRLSAALRSRFHVRESNVGDEALPDLRMESPELESLKHAARATAPWVVCPNCAGSAKCPGRTCLDGERQKCRCRGACFACEGLGLLTFGRHSELKNAHPAFEKGRR